MGFKLLLPSAGLGGEGIERSVVFSSSAMAGEAGFSASCRAPAISSQCLAPFAEVSTVAGLVRSSPL